MFVAFDLKPTTGSTGSRIMASPGGRGPGLLDSMLRLHGTPKAPSAGVDFSLELEELPQAPGVPAIAAPPRREERDREAGLMVRADDDTALMVRAGDDTALMVQADDETAVMAPKLYWWHLRLD